MVKNPPANSVDTAVQTPLKVDTTCHVATNHLHNFWA